MSEGSVTDSQELGDSYGNSSGSDEEEDHDTSWMEELQERSNTDNQQTNFPNKSTETVLGVTDVNSPSDDAAAAEEGGTVVNGAGNVSQIFLLSKTFTFDSCKSFTNLFVQESANNFSTGPNESIGMTKNHGSMLEKVPLADGYGELLSGDDEVSGAGTQKPYRAKKLRKPKIAPMQKELMWTSPSNVFVTLLQRVVKPFCLLVLVKRMTQKCLPFM